MLEEVGTLQAFALGSNLAFFSPVFVGFAESKVLDPSVVELVPILIVP